MVSTTERKNSKNNNLGNINSSLINTETIGSGINNDTMSTNFDDGTLIQYGESIRHGEGEI